jgi:hypothetical protein
LFFNNVEYQQLIEGLKTNRLLNQKHNIVYLGEFKCPFINKMGKHKDKQCQNRTNYSYVENNVVKYACGLHSKKYKDKILLPKYPLDDLENDMYYKIETIKPSTMVDKYWIYHSLPNNNKNNYDDGKWMLFFNKGSELDFFWYKLVNAYNNGDLLGVHSMKVSTMLNNPRSDDSNNIGVIILYCGPYDNKK